MNNQEVYDKVKAHLLSQGHKSLNANGDCSYRGENGAMCAVGVLIPDDMYQSSMEGNSCTSDAVGITLYKLRLDYSFANKLQQLHDSLAPEYWAAELELLALRNGLKP